MSNEIDHNAKELDNNSSYYDCPGITTLDRQIKLANGTLFHVLSSVPSTSQTQKKPTLVFLHGSFHGAWCWNEHYFPFFVSSGYSVVAPSWRGTSKTIATDEHKDKPNKKRKIRISEHVSDLKELLENLSEILVTDTRESRDAGLAATTGVMKPILICHSFGGLIAMKYLETMMENHRIRPKDLISGVISLCSVPPSGLNPMIQRSMWKSFRHTWKVIKGIPMKKATTDPALCRYLFFDGERDGGGLEMAGNNDFGISNDDLARYQEHFRQDSKSMIDVGDLAKSVPSRKADEKGRAPFVSGLSPDTVLVIGARHDRIVDMEGNVETAKFFGLQEKDLMVVDSPHDVMLGRNWAETARLIHDWIEQRTL